MKVGRFYTDNGEAWCVVDTETGQVRPLRGLLSEWGPLILEGGEGDLLYAGDSIPLAEVRALAPVSPTSRIFGVGSTYRRHVAQLKHVLGTSTDEEYPQTPGGFIKPHSAVVDPDGEISYPPTTAQLDFEIELVVVLGRALGKGEAAMSAVLGYTIGNDISGRDAKSRHGGPDYFSMKCLDRTAPIGPWITTKDELGGDSHPDVELTLSVNEEVRQHDRTSSMAWTVGELVGYVNERVAVAPGDLLFTGTTAGVGWEDGRFLEPGDVVEATIEGIGTLKNSIGKRKSQS